MKPERWQRIEQLYHAALERAANQRSAFLAQACADDAQLRSEVEMLIAANEQAGGFLATHAIELEARNIAAENSKETLAVKPGQALSHYTIISRVGAGGMGEVFLARDSVLERRVALKLLPVHFTQNPERLQRFVREAKAASALNHPNIITIHEIGEVDTSMGVTHFIATEFIEGQTLRTWTVDPEKRLRQTLNVVVQIASALDAAHKAGIVHRDVKPENVMVRPDGLVKVLDFGLAKLTSLTTDTAKTSAPTMLEGMKTRPGIILGTLRYMSPEQARGRSVDARSDIFSLGVVLYEILTGQPLFAGETDADVVAAIIYKEAPPLSRHLSGVPPELERIVQKALTKDIERRYQNALDLQIDLQALMRDSESSARLARSGAPATGRVTTQTSGRLAAPRFSLRQLLLVAPVLLLVAGAIWWVMTRSGNLVETPPLVSLQNSEVVRWASVPGETASNGAFSPDGKWIAFTSSKSDSRNIWVRQTVSGEDHQSTRDEFRNESPIWSPSGDEIAFFSLRRGGQPGIWRMPMLGGPLTPLKTLPPGESNIRLLRWSKDGAIIYYEAKKQIFALNVQSKEATQVTNFDQANLRGASLTVSHDEKKIAFITVEENGHRGVWFMPTRGGSPRRIVDTAAESSHTVWHPDGERLFYSSNVEGTSQIFVADVEGRQPAQITFGERDSFVVDVSADGAKVLCGSSEEKSDIWGVNVWKAGDEFVVASDISSELWPDISPDNKTVAYQAVRNLSQGNRIEHGEILTKPIGAKAEPFVLARDGFLPKWSANGKQIAFLRQENELYSLKTVNVGGGEEKAIATGGLRLSSFSVLPYTRAEASDFSWSPDGSKLAYCSIRDGFYNLRTISANGSDDTQVSDNKDANLYVYCPLWSSDGQRIAYATRPIKIAAPQDYVYSVWVAQPETKIVRLLAQMSTGNRLLGWSQSEQDLLVARYREEKKQTVVWRVSTVDGQQSLITELPPANLPSNHYNINLSHSRRLIAYVSHQEGKDNIWVIPAAGGAATKLTTNNDPQSYFSSLAWSPDSRAVYYGKQSRYSLLSMISNFK